jgi:hypothetical protein
MTYCRDTLSGHNSKGAINRVPTRLPVCYHLIFSVCILKKRFVVHKSGFPKLDFLNYNHFLT